MKTISVVISAWNEEKKLGRCLASVGFANEIIVIDSASTDKTVEIAKRFTKHVYARENNPMLNINKNYGFMKATGDWILCLDADEEVPQALAVEIQKAVQSASADVDGFWINRKNIIFGKWIEHGLWWPDPQLRLFRRNRGIFPGKHVHEKLLVEGATKQLDEPFVHHNYESISQFIRKMDSLYTESEVHRLASGGYQVVWYDAIRFPVSDFIKVYFAQQCYKDGLHGLVLSLFQAMYSLVVFAKMWEASGFEQRDLTNSAVENEFEQSAGEFSYWMLTGKIVRSTNYVAKMWYRLVRKTSQLLWPH